MRESAQQVSGWVNECKTMLAQAGLTQAGRVLKCLTCCASKTDCAPFEFVDCIERPVIA